MTTPASPNPISLADVQTEFGGSNPISLGEYYKGGSYVPTSITANIPSSGAIDLSIFRGVTKAPPDLSNYVNLANFSSYNWTQSWQEDIGNRVPNIVTKSVGAAGYPLICNQYTWDDVVNFSGATTGTTTNRSAPGSNIYGKPSPSFTMSNPQWLPARFTLTAVYGVHSHTRINFMFCRSDGTVLLQSGYQDYNFNVVHSNPGGTTYTLTGTFDIPANSSVTYYFLCNAQWNGDYEYAFHWWSGIKSANATFVGYV